MPGPSRSSVLSPSPLVLAAALPVGVALVTAGACVPPGSAPPQDAGATAAPVATFTPSTGIMTAPFEDDFERPEAGRTPPGARPSLLEVDGSGPAAREAGPFDAALGIDAAEAAAAEPGDPTLGPDWTTSKPGAWRIEKGKLCGQGARNRGIWLDRVLPVNAVVEFDALSESADGDLKAELWGDGRSHATSISYTNATSYLTILGGWKNTIHALARLDEHGRDRKELRVDKDSDDQRLHPVAAYQVYRFKVERSDGKTIRWWVNGLEMVSFPDPQPLVGKGHDHLGFNDWDVKVCFDNVKVTPL